MNPGALRTMRNWLRQRAPARLTERLQQGWQRVRGPFTPEPYRTVLPYTMLGLKRLRALDHLVHRIDELGIAGDVVECGTCNGGSGALLARVASGSPWTRRVWLLDSFAGLPASGPKDPPSAARLAGLCHGSPEQVRDVLARVGVPAESVTLVQGWFEDILPDLPVGAIALLHIDADWYESVSAVLEHLFAKVTPGGFVVLDDFGYWQGCRRAWEDYRASEGLQVDLTWVDGDAVYFQKPA
jgi:O-methyltransferase